jgi:ATP synthase protein I
MKRVWYPIPSVEAQEMGMGKGPTPEQQDLRAIGVATGLGCSIVAALVLCIGGGVWLDSRFGTTPVLTFVGIALGLGAAGYQLWELAKLGSKTEQAGPVTRTIARLPMPRAKRSPRKRGSRSRGREDERNEE